MDDQGSGEEKHEEYRRMVSRTFASEEEGNQFYDGSMLERRR
jgi:hypothetical protein